MEKDLARNSDASVAMQSSTSATEHQQTNSSDVDVAISEKITPTDPASAESQTYLYQNFSPFREVVFVFVVCSTQLLTQIAFGQVILPLHVIGAGLGVTSAGQESWIVAAYSLTVGTFVLPAGRLGDIYGSKLMILIGWCWLGLFSIIAGLAVFAPKENGSAVAMFAACQALRGIGGALLMPNALAIVGRLYPNGQRKNIIFAFFGLTAPIGGYTGMLFGSIFAQLAWWPWALWSFGIITALMGVLSWAIIPADEKRPAGQTFDYVGAALGVGGLILFNVAWNQAAVVSWGDAYVPVVLAIGIIMLAAFYFWEKRGKQPLLSPDTFNAGSITILAILASAWASFGTYVYFLIQIVTVLRGNSLLETCLQFLVLPPAGFAASMTVGLTIKKVPAPILLCISAACFFIGNILAATVPVDQIFWAQTFVSLLIVPFGMDISFPATAIVFSDMIPANLQGVSMSLVMTVVNYSISFGLGVAATAQLYVSRENPDPIVGFRSALYVSSGMAGLALLISSCFAVYSQVFKRKTSEQAKAG